MVNTMYRRASLIGLVWVSVVVIIMLAGGCATDPSLPERNFADRVGDANIMIASIADTTRATCGNTEPGGPCLSTSLLTRAEVDRIQLRLREASVLTDAASVAGPNMQANLSAALLVIAEIKQMLLTKEVTIP